MIYANRIISILYICISISLTNTKELETQNIERMKMNNNSNEWLSLVNEATKSKTGTFLAKDISNRLFTLEWERLNPADQEFNAVIKKFSDILTQTYTKQELQFAQKFPEAIPNEFFLKSLAPLFKHEIENINWNLVEEKISDIIKQFFLKSDFTKFSKPDDICLFVIAKNKQTKEVLGVIQFQFSLEFNYGNLRVGYYGVLPGQNSDLEKLLMSSIFKLIPEIERIFLHTRITNEEIIQNYKNWGFKQFPGNLKNWPDFEYIAQSTDILQKTAKRLD